MCKLKSAIILKDRVFIPDYDSHIEMLEELRIKDTKENASKLFVRAELSPKNDDVFSSIDTWEFKVDQDIIPEWFVAEYEKKRMIEAVKEWAKGRIHIGVIGLKISDGSNHYIKDCKDVEICGNASVKNIFGNASVEKIGGNTRVENICDNASVKYIYGSASVKYIYDSVIVGSICGNASVISICGNASVFSIWGNASVKNIFGNASVEKIGDNASVKYIYDNASVENICDSASVYKASGFSKISSSRNVRWYNKEKLIICENATFRDCFTKTIYQSGDYKLVAVNSEKEEHKNAVL